MADFRKWFMVIAVVLLTAASANALNIDTVTCSTSAQVPIIRDGGLTEYIGEIDLDCNNGYTTSVTLNFGLLLNATLSNSYGNGGAPLTMAGLAVQTQAVPPVVLSTYRGLEPVSPSSTLYFPSVVLPPATDITVRIFNVRVVAPAATSTYPYTQVLGLVTANTANGGGFAVTIAQQPPTGNVVAIVNPTMQFAVTNCNGTDLATTPPNIAVQQCIDERRGDQVYGVRFTELQLSAFKNLIEESGATVPVTPPPTPQICDTNTLVPQACSTGGGPWVTNGTRLLAQFAVPASLVGRIHLYVSRYQTAATSGATADLRTYEEPDGAGSDTISTEGFPINCAGGGNPASSIGGASGNRWVQLADGAIETAAWEIDSDQLGNLDSLTFAWTFSYDENELPSLPAGTAPFGIGVSGTLAPISTVAKSVNINATGGSVVRFNLPLSPSPVLLTIDHCVTNLLFPYVTNLASFNTGFAIANTSLDTGMNLNPPVTAGFQDGHTPPNPIPFNTTPQAGPCNLYLFGSGTPVTMDPATAIQDASHPANQNIAIASATTPNIVAGRVFASTLDQIFNLNPAGGDGLKLLTGYVIARCEFQFAHGYAFLTNANGAPTGYLALIIPDRDVLNPETGISVPTREAIPFSRETNDEQGEELVP